MKKRKNKNKIFTSVRMQMALTFTALMSFCILISILIAGVCIKKYYEQNKLNILKTDFEIINKIVTNADKTDSVDGNETDFETVMLVSSDTGEPGISEKTEKISMTDEKLSNQEIMQLDRLSMTDNLKIFLADPSLGEGYMYSTETSVPQLKRIGESLKKYINGESDNDKIELIVNESDFKIYRADDDYIGSVNYDLIGRLDNGYFCFIRMNYENIEETAAIAGNFYGYIGIIVILLEAIAIFIISRAFTKPLQKMNAAAKKIRNLDFDERIEVNSSNELGELAESINSLSENLENTILELKQANSELMIDIEKREKLDEMRRDFLGNVSHELKTPIAIIQGYAEGLKDNINEDAESREFYCDVIIDESARMNEMVKKLLSLNRIEYGENQLEIERFDVVELIKGILRATEVLSGNKDVRVSFEHDGPVYVYADEYMIEESISNYISNAYHHVSGENVIVVRLTKSEDRVRVSVFNTGSSIPDEDLDKVWIKFYKVDKARTREYGGSGIGLSIVKAVMELHNRKCGVTNHKNGVEFWLELDTMPVKKETALQED